MANSEKQTTLTIPLINLIDRPGQLVVLLGHLAARIMDSVDKARREIGYWTGISDMAYVQRRNKALGI